jgi:hypothetical protein
VYQVAYIYWGKKGAPLSRQTSSPFCVCVFVASSVYMLS